MVASENIHTDTAYLMQYNIKCKSNLVGFFLNAHHLQFPEFMLNTYINISIIEL